MRRLSPAKKEKWHIDCLLLSPFTHVLAVHRSPERECFWNQKIEGRILFPGFGATDCRYGCSSHLKFIAGSGDRK
jgi:Uri superfamily endonuclease